MDEPSDPRNGLLPSPAADPAASDDGPVTTLLPEDEPAVETRRAIARGLLWALALAVVVVTIAGWMALSAEQPSSDGQPQAVRPDPIDVTGKPAPDARFAVLGGQPSSIAELRGSPVVLNFWSATCVPCVTEMPEFEQVHQAYGDRVRFLGLAVADNESAAESQRRRTGVTYPLGFDPEGQIGTSYGIISIPATVLIDANGTVVHVTQGPALTASSLSSLISTKLRV